MLPYIEIAGRQLSMYALCIMSGVVLGILAAVFRADVFKVKKEDVLFSSFYGLLGLIAGGKILYLITIAPWLVRNFSEIISNMEYIKALMSGGFVFYGGLIGAAAFVMLYAWQYHISKIKLMEIIAPSIPLIHAFGRIGCFCAGCCYGRPFPPPVGMLFPALHGNSYKVTLFPVQLAEAGCNLILFLVMLGLFRKKETHGEAAALYLFAYGVIRFVLEFFRYDRERGFLLGLSTSQWFSIFAVLLSLFIIKKMRKRARD